MAGEFMAAKLMHVAKPANCWHSANMSKGLGMLK
jgi:hypothetical protein